ncbi:MAG: hypothetical protein FWH03_05420 [Firmicutes bacterium]|nr:hypothetical protein [Bacillota bacterium]
MMENRVSVNEVITRSNGGGFYRIKGNLINGGTVAEVALGVVSPKLYEITRRINSVNLETKKIYCECGREFHIDKDLVLIRCANEKT